MLVGVFGIFAILITFAVLCPGVVMIVGALKMMRLQSRSWATAGSILALLPFGLNPLSLAIGIWSLIVLNRRDVRLAFEAVRRDPSLAARERQGTPRSSKTPIVLAVLAALALMCVCPLGIAAMFFTSYVSHSRDVYVPAGTFNLPDETEPPTTVHSATPLTAAKWRGWDWGPDGPELYEPLARSGLNLDDEQIKKVNEILQAAYRDYLALEKLHRKHTRTDDGRQVTIIRRFPLVGVEDGIWSKLDAVIANKEQQRIARLNLKFLPPYRYPGSAGIPLAEYANPSLLGFGGDPARVEIERVGDWYGWRIDVITGEGEPDDEALGRDPPIGIRSSESGPELPPELRRFWIEPPAEAPE